MYTKLLCQGGTYSKNQSRQWRAFTLIELIIVLVILGVLASIAYIAYASLLKEAAVKALMATAQSVDRESVALGAFDQVAAATTVADVLGNPGNGFTATGEGVWERASMGVTVTLTAEGGYVFTKEGTPDVCYSPSILPVTSGFIRPLSEAGGVCSQGTTSDSAGPPDAGELPVVPASAVYAWGSNTSGQLGDGTETASYLPVAVDTAGVLSGKTVTQVSSGENHTCAVTSDGGAYCWGLNISGELGDGGATVYSTAPVAVDTTGVLSGKTVTQVSSGSSHTCAVTSDGGAYCWGTNSDGWLGDGTTDARFSPVAVDTTGVLSGKTVTQISSGSTHTCAVTSDGGAYCWGTNSDGQLGDGGATVFSTTPVAVDTTGVLSGKTVSQVSSGSTHTCAVTSDGGAYCWGSNYDGWLGDGTTNARFSPVAVDTTGVLSGKTVSQVSSGSTHTCAVTSDGGAYCWGTNSDGQLGDGGVTAFSTTPVAVDTTGVLSGKTVSQVSSGSTHTCAVTSDGGAYCWGSNYDGWLGDGTTNARFSPVAVDTTGVLSGKTVTQVSAGAGSTAVI